MEAKNREKIFINFKAYLLQIHRVKVCGNDKVGIDNDRLAISLVRKIMGQCPINWLTPETSGQTQNLETPVLLKV